MSWLKITDRVQTGCTLILLLTILLGKRIEDPGLYLVIYFINLICLGILLFGRLLTKKKDRSTSVGVKEER